jgi:hypothetical protein
MSDVQFSWISGKTVDVYVTNGSDQRYRFDTHVFENFNAANWAQYGSSLTEQGASGDYFGNLPTTGVAAGNYTITARERQGANPAIGDPVIGAPTLMTYSGVAWSAFGGGGGGGGGGTVGINEVDFSIVER